MKMNNKTEDIDADNRYFRAALQLLVPLSLMTLEENELLLWS